MVPSVQELWHRVLRKVEVFLATDVGFQFSVITAVTAYPTLGCFALALEKGELIVALRALGMGASTIALFGVAHLAAYTWVKLERR